MKQLYQDQNLPRISQLERQDAARKPHEQLALPATLPAVIRVGAFPPTDTRAAPFFRQLTPCRKCHWYSYTGHYNHHGNHQPTTTKSNKKKEPQTMVDHYYPADWCHACGRIASHVSLNTRVQCQPYQPGPRDIALGTKTIPFRIKVHDPRQMNMFRKNWTQFEKGRLAGMDLR
jgi:hypothetical protein